MAKLFWILLLTTCATAQTVEGSVVNSVTGVGIPGVKVEFFQKGKQVFSFTTDAQGHFLAEGVRDGSYEVHYSSPDYWPSDPHYPWLYTPGLGSYPSFQMIAGPNPVKLEGRMMPLPTLTGRILGSQGKPVPGARLELAGPATGMSYRTDAEGRFEAHQYLLPGAYTLWVTPPLGLKPPALEPDSDFALGWTRTFYPGVALWNASSKVVLQPGEVRDIEIKLLAMPAHAVRGVLLGSDGHPAPNVEITLGEGQQPMLSAKSQLDGIFEFPTVVDGEWRLHAESTRDVVDLEAEQWIEMAGHDIKEVKLSLSPPFTVHVKTAVDTPQGMPAPKPPFVGLSSHASRIKRDSGDFGGLRGPRAIGYGDFIFRDVYPGFYSINAFAPPGYFLDSILVGDAEMTTQEVEFSGPVSVTVTFKANGGTVRGTVEGCASGVVMFLPRDTASGRWEFVRTAKCDSSNHYDIAAMRPGAYSVLAFSAFPSMDYFRLWNAVMLSNSLLKQASSARVESGETSWVNLSAITSW